MHKHIEKTIKFFCVDEEKTFRESKYFEKINSLTHILGFSPIVSFGEKENSNYRLLTKKIYLDISIVDKKGSTVMLNELENEHLSYATSIAEIDKKKRILFMPWEDDVDFIETLEWIITELDTMVNP